MQVRILDLDGSVTSQSVLEDCASTVVDLRSWGPQLRLACGWDLFSQFECDLSRRLRATRDSLPSLTFIGSGDFHHVSLALTRRVPEMCNLLVIDKHPDWMCNVPFLHCGTWLNHAARLPQVHRVYHVGGGADFDNHYRWLAPWSLLRSGKIQVISASRSWHGSNWHQVPHSVLRREPTTPADRDRIEELIAGQRDDLALFPLYISLDRDVLTANHAVVNWDSGILIPTEIHDVIAAFRDASPGLLGMDVVGDWSAVRVDSWWRRVLDWTEHPWTHIDAELAKQCNERLNLEMMGWLEEANMGVTDIHHAR